ncbi:MAG: PKD domain-containing protein [Nitrospirae bacterium]|nr:PKD domain-containing protein [Nitrospirota bacterium]
MSLYNAKDEDGDIVQYKWWYFDLNDPDERLGIQITENPFAQITIGTLGKEGEKVEYGFGAEVTDSDNLKTSSVDILATDRIPTIEVVNGANELPVAKFNVNTTSIFAGDEITFTSASSDPDGTITKYIWDFEGNGFGNDEPTDKSVIKYAYTAKNLQGYNVRLKVIDDKGGESISDPITIYVDSTAKAPTASFTYQVVEGSSGKKIQFTNTSEVDEEAGARIISYIWDFDTNSLLVTADSNGDGIIDNDVDSQLEDPQRLYTTDGIYDVILTITDNQGNVDSHTEKIIIPMVEAAPEEVVVGEMPEPDTGLTAILLVDPIPANDGNIYLSDDSGSVTFDFSLSEGAIAYYIFDKNIHFDTDGNGIKNDDEDFKTSLPGTWKTNFEKEWGKTVVKLTVTDIYGNENSTTQEIKFQ